MLSVLDSLKKRKCIFQDKIIIVYLNNVPFQNNLKKIKNPSFSSKIRIFKIIVPVLKTYLTSIF